ncbi:hypothetical protein [Methanobrevibacter sp.]|uniref:hypothetical protein n=1 Tax=Methanobrevibacter sp. TaxID=66852 RepID=UPI0038680444
MAVYDFNVKGQEVQSKDKLPILVNDSYNYIELRFCFGENSEWENLTKRVLFRNEDNPVYCKQLDNENKVIVPFEVLTKGYFTFELYGITEEIRITTNQVTIYLKNSDYTEIVEETLLPTPSVMDDIYNKLNNTIEMEVTYSDDTVETYNVVVK